MTAVRWVDDELDRLHLSVVAYTNEALKTWRQADQQLMRGDPAEAERLYDLSEALSDAADAAQRQLSQAITKRVQASPKRPLVLY